jgi:hypothetical protein
MPGDSSRVRVSSTTSGFGGLWFLGFLGTLVYFIQFHSGTFWLVLLAIWKAIFWPAYLVYYLLVFMRV